MVMPGAYQPAGIIATVFDNDVESLLTAQPLGHMSYDYANQGFDSLHEAMDAAYEAHKNGEFASGSDADAAGQSLSFAERQGMMAGQFAAAGELPEGEHVHLG